MSCISPISPIRPNSPIFYDPGSLSALPSVINTASLIIIPLSQARDYPSRDQAKRKMRSVVNWVNWRAGPPSIGLLQILETPWRVAM